MSNSKRNLPPDWIIKESRRNPGKFFYANVKTGKTSWNPPKREDTKAQSAIFPLSKEKHKSKDDRPKVGSKRPGSGSESDSVESKPKISQTRKKSMPMVPRVILTAKRDVDQARLTNIRNKKTADLKGTRKKQKCSTKRDDHDLPKSRNELKVPERSESSATLNKPSGTNEEELGLSKYSHKKKHNRKRNKGQSESVSLVGTESNVGTQKNKNTRNLPAVSDSYNESSSEVSKSVALDLCKSKIQSELEKPPLRPSTTVTIVPSKRSKSDSHEQDSYTTDKHEVNTRTPYKQNKPDVTTETRQNPSSETRWKPIQTPPVRQVQDITPKTRKIPGKRPIIISLNKSTSNVIALKGKGPVQYLNKSTSNVPKQTAAIKTTTGANDSPKPPHTKLVSYDYDQSTQDSTPRTAPSPLQGAPCHAQSPRFGCTEGRVTTSTKHVQHSQSQLSTPSQEVFDVSRNVPFTVQSDPTPGSSNAPDPVAMEIDADSSAEVKDMELGLTEVREALMGHSTQVVGHLTDWVMRAADTAHQSPGGSSSPSTTALYVVLDTNILLHHLKYMDELKDENFEGFGRPFLVVPWVVLQELDGLKNAKKIKNSISLNLHTQLFARNSVQYLNRCLQSHHPRVLGQSPAESSEVMSGLRIECNDDRILQCVLKWEQKYPDSTVILLTEDINLRNKAMVMHQQAHSTKSLTEWLSQASSKDKEEEQEDQSEVKTNLEERLADDILCEVKSQLRTPLSVVMETEMKDIYGNLWTAIVFRKPPWTMKDLLDCFNKHWIAVFGMFLPRDCKMHVESLRKHYQLGEGYGLTVKDVSEALYDAISFSQALVQHSSHGSILKEPIVRLEQLDKLCKEVTWGKRDAADLATMEGRNQGNYTNMNQSVVESTTPGSADPNGNPVTDAEKLLQSMQLKFQIAWENILYCKECLESFLHSDEAQTHSQRRREYIGFLGRLVRTLKPLDAAYMGMLSLGVSEMEASYQVFVDMARALDLLAVQTCIQPWDPVVPEALLVFSRDARSRPLLENGYTQLQEFLVGLHNCWLQLTPHEQAELNL